MRFWELADARNAVFCRTKLASEDGWGSLSSGRFRDGPGSAFETVPAMLGSWSDRPRIGNAKKKVSHESFAFASSTFRFWGSSHTKATFSHLPLSLFEETLARKLRFHISTFTFWRNSRTKSSFSHLSLSDFEGKITTTKTNGDSPGPAEAAGSPEHQTTNRHNHQKKDTPGRAEATGHQKRNTHSSNQQQWTLPATATKKKRDTTEGQNTQTKKQKDTSTWAEAPERQKTITNTTTQGKKTNTPGREEAPHTPKN